MLNELEKPAFVEVIEKALYIGIKNVTHLLLHERIGQRIQRLVRAAPRTKTIREAEKVFLVNLVENCDYSLLNDCVVQCSDPNGRFRPSSFSMYTLRDG